MAVEFGPQRIMDGNDSLMTKFRYGPSDFTLKSHCQPVPVDLRSGVPCSFDLRMALRSTETQKITVLFF